MFLAPAFSSLTSIMTYLLTFELHSVGVGSWTYLFKQFLPYNQLFY